MVMMGSLPLTRHPDLVLVLDTAKGMFIFIFLILESLHFFYWDFCNGEEAGATRVRNANGFQERGKRGCGDDSKIWKERNMSLQPEDGERVVITHSIRLISLLTSILTSIFPLNPSFPKPRFIKTNTNISPPFSGRGVFASSPIPAHSVLETCPVLILDPQENKEHIEKTEMFHYT